MVSFASAVGIAAAAWFVAAGALFFNPIVDRIYREQEAHPAVRNLPKRPGTIGKILLAVLVQCVLWAWAYAMLKSTMTGSMVTNGLLFGTIIVLLKIIPRDIDRLLLTTYPGRRMAVEFVVGIICAYVVGLAFAWLL